MCIFLRIVTAVSKLHVNVFFMYVCACIYMYLLYPIVKKLLVQLDLFRQFFYCIYDCSFSILAL